MTPPKFPVIVNGMFLERIAEKAHDRIYARCLVMDDGASKVAVVVVDSCMMPRDLLDAAKEMARARTGIPSNGCWCQPRILIPPRQPWDASARIRTTTT